jgi:hypothetical protein
MGSRAVAALQAQLARAMKQPPPSHGGKRHLGTCPRESQMVGRSWRSWRLIAWPGSRGAACGDRPACRHAAEATAYLAALLPGYLDADGEDRCYVDETFPSPRSGCTNPPAAFPRLPGTVRRCPCPKVRLAVGAAPVRKPPPSRPPGRPDAPGGGFSPALPLAQSYDRARYSDHPVTDGRRRRPGNRCGRERKT